jgi:hypothetical protein
MESYKYFSKIALYVRIFEEKNRSFSPVSPKQLRRSGSNIFFKYFEEIGVRVFFLQDVVSIKFCSLWETRTIEKTRFLILMVS